MPNLLERGYELIAQTRMRPFHTVSELGAYLKVLQGIRDSLDRFSPTVFERPLGELIQAHGPRRDAPSLTGAQRRRLRRLSREYVRPGVHIADMHEALLRVQQQRTEWQRFVEAGVIPAVPLGLADVHVAWQRVDAELGELDAIVGRTGADRLASLPVAQLVRTLAGLAADSEVFDNLVERATLRTELAALGLEPLLAELSVRHVPEDLVGDELEFAWWQSALEHLLRTDRALLGREHDRGRPARARLPTRRRGACRGIRSSARRPARDPVAHRNRRRRGRGRRPQDARSRTAARRRPIWSRQRPRCCALSRRSGSHRPTTCRRFRTTSRSTS